MFVACRWPTISLRSLRRRATTPPSATCGASASLCTVCRVCSLHSSTRTSISVRRFDRSIHSSPIGTVRSVGSSQCSTSSKYPVSYCSRWSRPLKTMVRFHTEYCFGSKIQLTVIFAWLLCFRLPRGVVYYIRRVLSLLHATHYLSVPSVGKEKIFNSGKFWGPVYFFH